MVDTLEGAFVTVGQETLELFDFLVLLGASLLVLLFQKGDFALLLLHLSLVSGHTLSQLSNRVCLLGPPRFFLLESRTQLFFQLAVLPHLVQSVSLPLTHGLQHFLLSLDHRLLLLQLPLHDLHGVSESIHVLLVVLLILFRSHFLFVSAGLVHFLHLEGQVSVALLEGVDLGVGLFLLELVLFLQRLDVFRDLVVFVEVVLLLTLELVL